MGLPGLGDLSGQRHHQHAQPHGEFDRYLTYTSPGTYFPVIRITSQRQGDPNALYGLIQNLAGHSVVGYQPASDPVVALYLDQ